MYNINNNFKLTSFLLPIQQNLDDLSLNLSTTLDSIWNKVFSSTDVIVNQGDISLENRIYLNDIEEDQEVVIKEISDVDYSDDNTGVYSEEAEKDLTSNGYSSILFAKDYSSDLSSDVSSDGEEVSSIDESIDESTDMEESDTGSVIIRSQEEIEEWVAMQKEVDEDIEALGLNEENQDELTSQEPITNPLRPKLQPKFLKSHDADDYFADTNLALRRAACLGFRVKI